jgi:cell division protease FtsH
VKKIILYFYLMLLKKLLYIIRALIKPTNLSMQNFRKNFLIWALIFGFLIYLSESFGDGAGIGESKISFSEFMNKVDNGEVTKVDIRGQDLNGTLKSGGKFYTFLPNYPNLVEKLQEKQVEVNAVPLVSKSEKIIGGILGWLPFILMIGIWIFFMRGAGGGKGALSFGKSKAKLLQENKQKVTFADVAGIDEAKEELVELVDFLKDPQKYIKLGARIPRGCLLIGSPGTGKTLLARAIAGEAGVPFFSISGSDFVEMFVGVGASRVRDMFEQGKKNAPCIIFIDEIDAVGRHRGSGVGGGNDEREQTLNQLLVEMDGFSDNEGVIIVAATNRPDVLDRALLRPGRFDRQITVPNPDIIGREQILNVHIKKIISAPDVDVKTVARGTPGFSGADLANLVNEAALMAAKSNQRLVGMKDLENAKDKIMMGAERKSMVMQQDEKELTAYHEAGHAVVAINCANSDPIHKATIIPRGRALGLVMRLPERDQFSVTRAKLIDDLAVAMGGRAAEELIFGYDKVTTGASSDIKQATRMAKSMITKWGLSDKMGLQEDALWAW